ncbi:MAG TPA: ABC transporter permease [Pyrinomonadaceae bacterium]
MNSLAQDFRYGVRLLFKNPGFTFVAVLSLALGIGANATIFSFVNAILLRPLPVEEPDQLVRLYTTSAGSDRIGAFSHQDYLDIREHNNALSGLIAERLKPMSLSGDGQNEIIPGAIVSGNYFSVLGVQAAQGRTFLPEEDQTPNTHPVAVVSYGLWQRRFGSDPNLLGKTVSLSGHGFTVIGIAPQNFTGTTLGQTPDVWVPLMMQAQAVPGPTMINSRDMRWLNVTGRLKPGVTIAQAQSSINAIAKQLAEQSPKTNAGTGVSIHSVSNTPDGPKKMMFPVLGVLTIVVGLILLIACANIANLLLARAAARRKEIGIRLALGASRVRLIRQLLTESLMLSVLGGTVGLLAAVWTPGLLFAALKPPTAFPIVIDFTLDRRMLTFTIILSLVTGLIFGLLPALNASKLDLTSVLKDEAGALGRATRRSNLRSVLVVAQVTLSLVLLISSGLFIRSLQGAQAINPGFDADKLLVMSYNVGLQGYDEAKGKVFNRELIERVSNLPGVTSASLAESIPLGGSSNQLKIEVEGYQLKPNETLSIDYNTVGKEYFKTMGIPVLKGRDFNDQDREGAEGSVIVNETMAKRLWPGVDPIGKRLKPLGSTKPYLQVVGVAKNGKYRRLKEDPLSFMYLALDRSYSPGVSLYVRTAGDPQNSLETVRQAVQTMDKNLPVYNAKTMTESIGLSLFDQRMAATLLGFFGLLALILAAIGLYGVMAYSVGQRRRELGIRMALGAQKSNVLKLVVGQGLKLTLIGTAIGLIAAFGLMRLASSMLYGVSASDPLTFAGAALLLVFVALLASFIPARKATKVDPMVALRFQ